MQIPNIQPYSDEEYFNAKIKAYNSTSGKLNEFDGYNCEYCHNKGHIAISINGEMCSASCPQCANIRKCIKIFKKSGLSRYSFENYTTENEWQKKLLYAVQKYTADVNRKWLFIGGQSGSGKTHLCSAVLRVLIFNYKKETLLFEWAEKSKRLKQLANDPQYDDELNKYKVVPVLYIDDLFKSKRGETPTTADINLAFELVDYRYRNDLITIISSELSIDDIIVIDEATGSRIKHKAKEYALHISKDKNKNYRLK